MKRFFIRLSILFLLASALAGAHFSLAEGGEAALTLMVYISGSDLESVGGAATGDIAEIMRSGVDTDRVNIILCTGGARTWRGGFPNDRVCFYRVAGRRPEQLEALELTSMGDPATLSRFLNYAHEQFPARQYALILWDHGGGPMNGVCFDELFSSGGGSDALALGELQTALQNSPFDAEHPLEWIGFDACLMSSIETAYICAPHAKYMIASQETEPGTGWNYSFLSRAAEGLSGDEMGRLIVESYTERAGDSNLMLTLACVDLAGVPRVETAVDDLFASLDGMLSPELFSRISNGRRDAKSFGRASTGSEYDLVDLYSLSEQYSGVAPDKARALQAALDSAIVCNSGNQENSHGLSIYYPYYNKDYYRASWQRQYEAWGFAGEYCAFMADYADLWLGEPLADWSGTRAAALPSLPEGQEFTMTLTPEQAENFAYAQLYIVSELPQNVPYYFKTDETDGVERTDDGVLHARYNYKALYAVDGEGNPLSDAIPYRIVDGFYLIRANLTDKTWEAYQSELFPGDLVIDEDASIAARKVYLQCVLNGETDGLEIVGVIDLREDLGEDAAGLLAEGDGLYTGKQSISLDSEAFSWIWFLRHPRVIQFDSRGNPLAYPEWKDPADDGQYLTEWDEIDNTKPWSLRFCNQQYTGQNLYAQFVVHDTQGNLAASDLLPVTNPNLIRLPVERETLYEAEDFSVTLTAANVAASSFDDGLFLRFDIRQGAENAADGKILVENVVLGSCLISKTYHLYQSVEPDGHIGYVLNIPSADLPDALKSAPDGLRFDLLVLDDALNETRRISAGTAQRLDISAIHRPSASQDVLAETAVGDVCYRAVGLDTDASGDILLELVVENRSGQSVDCTLTGDAVVNGCEWAGALSSKVLTLPADCWTAETVRISPLSTLETSAWNRCGLPQYSFLQRWGIDGITGIGLMNCDDQVIRLELGEPFFPDADRIPEAKLCAARELAVLESEELNVAVRDYVLREDALLLILEIGNLAEEPLEILPAEARVNGRAASSAMRDMSLFDLNLSPYPVDAGLRKDVVLEIALEEMQEPVESVEFSLAYRRTGSGEKRFCTPALLRFARPVWAEQADGTAYGTEEIEVQPSELLENGAIDPASIIDLSVSAPGPLEDHAVLLRAPLSGEERERFDHGTVRLLASGESMQFVCTLPSPVELDEDGLSCAFSGLLVCMDGADYPLTQRMRPTEDGYECDLMNVEILTDDRFELYSCPGLEAFTIALSAQGGEASVSALSLSRPIGAAERIRGQLYTSMACAYADGEGSPLETTSIMKGESMDLPDGRLKFKVCPAAELNPYVVFSIVNKDGSAYTRALDYRDCAS